MNIITYSLIRLVLNYSPSLFSFFSDKFSYVLVLMQRTHWRSSIYKVTCHLYFYIYIFIKSRTQHVEILFYYSLTFSNQISPGEDVVYDRCHTCGPWSRWYVEYHSSFLGWLYKIFFSHTSRWWDVLFSVSILACKINAQLDLRIDRTGKNSMKACTETEVTCIKPGKILSPKSPCKKQLLGLESSSQGHTDTWQNKIWSLDFQVITLLHRLIFMKVFFYCSIRLGHHM